VADVCGCREGQLVERRRRVVREEAFQGGRQAVGPRDGVGHSSRVRSNAQRD